MTTELKLKAKAVQTRDGIRVTWRTEDGIEARTGIGLGSNHRSLALRLCRAIEAGVIVKNPRVVTRNGETYLTDDHLTILMRCANAELTRLGF